jgi:hypothetical protein
MVMVVMSPIRKFGRFCEFRDPVNQVVIGSGLTRYPFQWNQYYARG